MARVTAIISAYFAEDYIERRLDNLQGQDCRSIAIAKKDSAEARVLLDRGIDTILTDGVPTIYDAWNQMIEQSDTPYITNANCDDLVYPGAYKKMADALDEHPKFALAYPNIDVDTDGTIRTVETAEGDFEFLKNNCFVGPMPMWRKSLHDQYGLFNEKLHVAGDFDFWLRIAAKGERFFHIRGKPLGMYTNRPDSAEHREGLRSIWETAKVRSPYLRRI